MTDSQHEVERLSGVVSELRRAITTASNDDYSEPMSDKRQRHTQRIMAMLEAVALLNDINRKTTPEGK